MKHTVKITLILLVMFFLAQLIGIFVAHVYQPEITVNQTTGEEVKIYDLPYGLEPPADVNPQASVVSIMIALIIAVIIMFTLMRFKAETFLRLWFLLVVILGIAIALNAFLIKIPYSAIAAFVIALPLGIIKIFKRDIIVHNVTELLVYPGIASVFIPLLNIWAVVILLILISIYDMYAVWHAGFMQKMAKYQMEKLKIFSGFFVPYVGKKEKELIKKSSRSKKKTKSQKVGVNVAILGGGDVVFPIILAGTVLWTWGLMQALIIAVGATVALAYLFYKSEKGKFYPAMPFITTGCFIALAVAWAITYLV